MEVVRVNESSENTLAERDCVKRSSLTGHSLEENTFLLWLAGSLVRFS